LAPRAAVESLRWASPPGNRASAVYLDQPFHRSLTLIRMLWPAAERLGVLYSAEETAGLRTLRSEAARKRLRLILEPVAEPRDTPQALRRLLPQIDVLLLTPDPNIVNELNARLILVASYRQNVPVVAFSRGLVNAGAVASVVSDPEDIGREGALLARHWNPAGGSLPPARHASGFDMVLNRQVARSLGIDLRNREDWLKRLRENE
jgi:ABC-type uncharacterized transport system substrate-binding protein